MRAPALHSSCWRGACSAASPCYFDVEGFSVSVERRHNALGKLVSVSQAVVKTRIGGERVLTVAEGNGPVNALDKALRKDLGAYRTVIADLELVDYKVRILNGGTEAVTRVLIESSDLVRRLVVHRRRLRERRRCLLRGALRFGRLQAAQGGGGARLTADHINRAPSPDSSAACGVRASSVRMVGMTSSTVSTKVTGSRLWPPAKALLRKPSSPMRRNSATSGS